MTKTICDRFVGSSLIAITCLLTAYSQAEPYFAVQTGYKCITCHVSPTGGGMRNTFGAMYGQTALSRKIVGDLWDGTVAGKLALGGDLRANALLRRVPGQDDNSVFETEEALIYARFSLLKDRLTFYLDQRVAPGGASSREAYALLWSADKRNYVRAGRMFLPYGWRLEDDTAFIRQVPGINYNTPDDGIEIGRETKSWSLNLALTNGTAGAGDTDSGKQWSARAAFVRPGWRLGSSVNFNDVSGGSRRMGNVFVGVKTGRVAWLAQVDYIDDAGFATGPRQQWLAFGEADITLSKGYNLKLTYEYFDPDNELNEDDANRTSVVLEGFPIQFIQFSVGARFGDGIPQNNQFNSDEYFLQLHTYF